MDRQIYELIDSVAEHMVMNGKRPCAGLKELDKTKLLRNLSQKIIRYFRGAGGEIE